MNDVDREIDNDEKHASYEREAIGCTLGLGTETDFTKCWEDDGGVFTEETTDVNDVGAGDWYPVPAAPAVNDAFYFGYSAAE